MAAKLARTRADVSTGVVDHEGVSVLVRNSVATLRRGRDVVAERSGVVAVNQYSRRPMRWHVTFDDGAVWSVSDKGCLPCGGAR